MRGPWSPIRGEVFDERGLTRPRQALGDRMPKDAGRKKLEEMAATGGSTSPAAKPAQV